MDSTGWTVEELGARIGRLPPQRRGGAAPHHRADGVAQSAAGHEALLASGNLKPSEATELMRLSPRGQHTLFNAIRTGGCRN
jgi:hypothetical protein